MDGGFPVNARGQQRRHGSLCLAVQNEKPMSIKHCRTSLWHVDITSEAVRCLGAGEETKATTIVVRLHDSWRRQRCRVATWSKTNSKYAMVGIYLSELARSSSYPHLSVVCFPTSLQHPSNFGCLNFLVTIPALDSGLLGKSPVKRLHHPHLLLWVGPFSGAAV